MFKKNDHGSVSVFLCIVLSALLAASIAMVAITKSVISRGYIDSVVSLSGRSALSEYNPKLQERYGIFAVSALSPEVERRMKKYCNYSFALKQDISMDALAVNTDEHSYRNLKVFVEDLREAIVFESLHLIEEKSDNAGSEGKRTLRNKKIIANLPSENEELFIDQEVKLTDTVVVDQYIMTLFSDAIYKRSTEDSFFKNEVEYVICGHKSDQKNYKRFGRRIIAVRLPINLAYIYSRPDMVAKVNAVSQLMFPGLGGAIAQAAVASAWARLESENDLKILRDKGKVPITKTPQTWATDIASLLEGGNAEGYIDTYCQTGMDYQDFLRSQLLLMNRKKKILRMMDVMQINIQGTYDENFQMLMAHRGMKVEAEIEGRSYRYEERL